VRADRGPAVLVAAIAVGLLCTHSAGWAQETLRDEAPPPSSVEQSITPIERAFKLLPERPGLLPRLKERLKDAPPFLRDTKIDVNLRTFYLNQKKYDDNHAEALAGGGALSYRSGWLLDRLAIGAAFYLSEPLYAPEERDGTNLLQPGQRGYASVGQLNARVRILDGQFLNLYRQAYDTPYMNRNDSRMTPNTFEGYSLQGVLGGKDGEPALRYGAGYISKIKERVSEDFVWMSRQAGAGVDRGVGVLGALFSYAGLSVGAIDYYSGDIINIGYAEGKYVVALPGEIGVLFAAQYTDERSVGGELLQGHSFATDQLGVKAEASRAGAVLTLAYTRVDRGADMQKPWSGNPGYTGAMVQSFNRAGEQTYLAKASYDFSRLGAPGLTVYALYARGWDRVDPRTKTPVPNEHEVNVDVQWRPGWMNGLWLRARYGHVEQYGKPGNTLNDFRLIANYDVSLF
jgi:hypothetical protein